VKQELTIVNTNDCESSNTSTQGNNMKIKHGDVCVYRMVHGEQLMLPLINQARYAEWAGCFSYINLAIERSETA